MLLFSRFRIAGHSMTPTISSDENVLASSLPFLFKSPKEGDVVVFEKDKTYFVKRIEKIKDDGYFLSGDNKTDSYDSRGFGLVNKSKIKGKVIFKWD